MNRIVLGLLFFAGVSGSVLAQDAREETEIDFDARPMNNAAKILTPAERREERLDQLFGKLQNRDAEQDAASKIEQDIWAVWMASGSSTSDLLLQQATKAMADHEFVISESILDRLVEHNETFSEAYNRRATLFFMMGRLDDALRDIERVLEIEPRHFGALSGRGMIFKEQGKLQEALEAYREALAVHPHMAGVNAAVKELEKNSPDI